MPVLKYRDKKAQVVTFITIQPTSEGSPPAGTFRRVQAAISTFSAPWGYRAGSRRTSTRRSGVDTVLAILDSSAMAAGLFLSMAMITREAFRNSITVCTPDTTSQEFSMHSR